MMKVNKLVLFIVFGFTAVFLTDCQGFGPTGILFSSTNTGIYGTTSTAPKRGNACVHSVLGLVAFGDGSVKAASEMGGIQKVSAINLRGFNIVSFYSRLCTEVWGE